MVPKKMNGFRPAGPASLLFLCFLCVSGLLAGCSREDISPVGPVEAAERDSLIASINRIQTDGIRSAFDRIEDYAYTRYIRTEQYDAEDFLLAYTEHEVEVTGADGAQMVDIQQADSGGAFDFGLFNRFVSENVETLDPVNLVPYVIPEDPAYLNPRNRDKYAFRAAGDTLLWDREADIIEVRAKPNLADGMNIRRARYYVDPVTHQLVAMYLERIDLALFFREESSFYVHVRPFAPSGAEVTSADTTFVLLPYNTRFESRIRTPFRGAYKVRTVSTFTGYERIGSDN